MNGLAWLGAHEPKELTQKIKESEDKMLYYARMVPVAHRVHEAKEKK